MVLLSSQIIVITGNLSGNMMMNLNKDLYLPLTKVNKNINGFDSIQPLESIIINQHEVILHWIVAKIPSTLEWN